MNAPKTSIGVVTGKPGDQVVVPITVLEDCDVVAITLSISFIPAKTKFIRWMKDDFLPPSVMVNIVKSPGKPSRNTLMYTWVSPDGMNIHIKAGTILCLALFEYIEGNSKFFFEDSNDQDFCICEYATGVPATAMVNAPGTYIDGYAVAPPTLW